MTSVEVIRKADLRSGDSTDGILRSRAFESENIIFSQSRIRARVASGWHHHGTRQLYGFLVSGTLQLECSGTPTSIVELNSGDFFHIHAGLVHRDLNPDRDHEALVINILVGEGPAVVNLPPSTAY